MFWLLSALNSRNIWHWQAPTNAIRSTKLHASLLLSHHLYCWGTRTMIHSKRITKTFKVNPNQVWPGFDRCQFSIADFRRAKSRIYLTFSVLVYWLSKNKHRNFQIEPTFWSYEISNWKLAAVDPGSHLIEIYFILFTVLDVDWNSHIFVIEPFNANEHHTITMNHDM